MRGFQVAMTRVLFAGIAVTALSGAPVLAQDDAAFVGPSTEGFVRNQKGIFDFDDDGEPETFAQGFTNRAGDQLIEYAALGGIIWAVLFKSAGSDESYVLSDTDCDGRFDQRAPISEGVVRPSCLDSH